MTPTHCSRCRTELPPFALACPACGLLIHTERLKQLAAEALKEVLARREVLVLEGRDRRSGLRSGLTANYVEVQFPASDEPGRGVVPFDVTEVQGERTIGRLVKDGA